MNKTEKKVAELEKRVKELEARPQVIFLPVQVVPYAPPFNPWYPYGNRITCSETGAAYTSGNTGVVANWGSR